MEKLEEVRKLVDMLQKEPICIDDVIKSPPAGIKELLLQLKDDYFNYKCIIRGQETRLRLLNNIKAGTTCSLAEAQAEAATVKQKRDRLNERTEELKTSLTQYAQELPGLRDTLKVAIVQLDEAMDEATKQATQLYERKEELKNDVEKNIREKEVAIAEYEKRLKELDVQIQSAESQLGNVSY